MPKGYYIRKRRSIDMWNDEHDVEIRLLLDLGLSFAKITPKLNEMFPGHNWTRSAVIGRAHRSGIRSKRKAGREVGEIRKPRKVVDTQKAASRKLVALYMKKQEQSAPIVFKEPSLRDDAEPILRRSSSGSYTRRKTADQINEIKKGHLPCIIEEKPLSSVPVAQVEAKCCMWPTSEDIRCMEVCGAPAAIGAYCARHASVGYREMPTRKRNRTRFKEDRDFERRIDKQERDRLDPDGEWLTRQILASMDEVEVVGDAPLMIPAFLDVLKGEA